MSSEALIDLLQLLAKSEITASFSGDGRRLRVLLEKRVRVGKRRLPRRVQQEIAVDVGVLSQMYPGALESCFRNGIEDFNRQVKDFIADNPNPTE